MPGPGGGGGRSFGGGGGGFGGGGGRSFGGGGGGFGGGGFGGGHHGYHHHHHHHGGFWFHRPYYGYGYGGGCLGGLIGAIMMPIILITFSVIFLLAILLSAFSDVASGGSVNKNDINEYALIEYQNHFGTSEDCVLLTVLVDEDCASGYYTNMVGFHLDKKIYNLFYDEPIEIGLAAGENTYSAIYLTNDLKATVEDLEASILELDLASHFTCDEDHNAGKSELINKTAFNLQSGAVNEWLESFTEKTGISIAIVVEDIDDAVERSASPASFVTVFVCLIFMAVGIYLLVRAVRNRKSGTPD